MRRIAKLLLIISIAFVFTIAYMHCYNVMGKVPSIKMPPASYEVLSLAFTLSDGEIEVLLPELIENQNVSKQP